MARFLLSTVSKGTKSMTNRVRLWYVPVNESEKAMEVPPMPYKSSEQEAIGRDVYEEQKTFRSKTADMPASFDRDTPGAGNYCCLLGFICSRVVLTEMSYGTSIRVVTVCL